MASLADLGALLPDDYVAETVQQSRKAGQGLTMTANQLKELMEPWENYERGGGNPNYFGRSESEWIDDNARIRSELQELANRSDREALLKRNGFSSPLERNNILYNLERKPVLHTQDFWVPGAVADEKMSEALLHYSGFSPVKLGNEGDPMATDLMATMNGQPMRIDAQTRTSPDAGLRLGVTKYNRDGNMQAIRRGDDKLIDILKDFKKAGIRVEEDKLLHTLNRDYNPIQSAKFNERALTHVKDMLISSNRAGFQGVGHQPYSPEKPYGWDLVDLERAREIILPQSLSDLNDKYGITTVDPRSRSGEKGLKLVLPFDFVERELRPDKDKRLGSEAIRQLSRTRR